MANNILLIIFIVLFAITMIYFSVVTYNMSPAKSFKDGYTQGFKDAFKFMVESVMDTAKKAKENKNAAGDKN